jgi:hypothetical protein
MFNHCPGRACLSLAEEGDTFPRMNYRRKKISMKERLEEAIEEIGDELLQGSGFEREALDEMFSKIEPAATAAGGKLKVTVERSIGVFEIPARVRNLHFS